MIVKELFDQKPFSSLSSVLLTFNCLTCPSVRATSLSSSSSIGLDCAWGLVAYRSSLSICTRRHTHRGGREQRVSREKERSYLGYFSEMAQKPRSFPAPQSITSLVLALSSRSGLFKMLLPCRTDCCCCCCRVFSERANWAGIGASGAGLVGVFWSGMLPMGRRVGTCALLLAVANGHGGCCCWGWNGIEGVNAPATGCGCWNGSDWTPPVAETKEKKNKGRQLI